MKISLRRQGLSWKREYAKYSWSGRELLWEIVRAIAVTLLYAWFFYRSIWAAVPMAVIGYLEFQRRKQEKAAQCKRLLIVQFQECILSVAASLRAGYSVENAFRESLPDMRRLYGDKAYICQEIELINRGLVINITLEELLDDLGKRSGAEEIIEFAEVISIAKRSGGSIPEIIRSSAQLIRQKVEAEEEIRTAVSAKRLEQRIMGAMPFAIVIYVQSTNPGYFDILYHNLTGVIVMSGCLVVYLTACRMSDRILKQACSLWGEGE